MVQAEPWLERDRAMIDALKSIGIEQGKAFAPDTMTTETFAAAGAEARAWFDDRYETRSCHNSVSRWFFPADESYVKAVGTGFTQTDIYPTDARGTLYYFVYSSVKHPGAGRSLPVRLTRQGRQSIGRRGELPPSRAAEATGAAVLVGGAVRLRHARADPRHAPFEQVVAVARPGDEHQRLGGRVPQYRRPPARNRTGSRPTPGGVSRLCFASMGRRSRCSRKPGCSPISRRGCQTNACTRHGCRAPATPIPVTVDNFIRAESDLYFTVVRVKEGFFGRFGHHRELMPIDKQTIIRTDRDTLCTFRGFRSRRRTGDGHDARPGQPLHVAADDQRGRVSPPDAVRARHLHVHPGAGRYALHHPRRANARESDGSG